jgi:hypothetical protein
MMPRTIEIAREVFWWQNRRVNDQRSVMLSAFEKVPINQPFTTTPSENYDSADFESILTLSVAANLDPNLSGSILFSHCSNCKPFYTIDKSLHLLTMADRVPSRYSPNFRLARRPESPTYPVLYNRPGILPSPSSPKFPSNSG